MNGFAARNTSGFSSQISSGRLPQSNHISYEGVFNQIKFDVGAQPDKVVDLHCGYARYQFTSSLVDKELNDYLAIFVKSSKDGKDRDQRSINALICLDISGSMGGVLTSSYQNDHRSRLSLSIEAIKMLISKLRPNDSVGFVTFNNKAQIIFQPIFKKDLNEEIFTLFDRIKAGGGTTLSPGFETSKKLLEKWMQDHPSKHAENRIIMLTDVDDNSIENERKFIENSSMNSNINLTIIGISSEFKSSVCEKLKMVRGFNYFCAVNQEDIKKYVFQTFDFGFFPSAYDLDISITSNNVVSFETFGAPDYQLVQQYNHNFVPSQIFTISKVKSTFPSQIEIVNGNILTYGGLILLKLKCKQKQASFKEEIILRYTDVYGQIYEQKYPLFFQFHPEQQFFSQPCLRQAVDAYIFASEMRNILKESSQLSRKDLHNRCKPLLKDLALIVPSSKAKELKSISQIIESINQ